jgi:hypothetical protein
MNIKLIKNNRIVFQMSEILRKTGSKTRIDKKSTRIISLIDEELAQQNIKEMYGIGNISACT